MINNQSKGLGDTVEKIIDKVTGGKVTKENCGGCKKRKEWLNGVFSYRKMPKGHRDKMNFIKRKYPILVNEFAAMEEKILQLKRQNVSLRMLYKKLVKNGSFQKLDSGLKIEVKNAAGLPIKKQNNVTTAKGSSATTLSKN